MAIVLAQNLFSGQSKASGASLVISGSATVTLGNTLFVGWAGDTGGSAHGCVDNLGNVYSIVEERNNAGNVRAILFQAPVTVAGTLTSQTVSWTTNITAKAARSVEFSDVGQAREIAIGTTGTSATPDLMAANTSVPTGGMAISTLGVEDEVLVGGATPTYTPALSALGFGTIGTSGAGGASNISVNTVYVKNTVSRPSENGVSTGAGSGDFAAASAVYYPATSPQESAVLPASCTDNSGIGTVAWTNPNNGAVTNNTYTTVTLTASQTSHYLKTLNYLFNVLSSKAIAGVEVVVECKSALGLAQNLSVRLVVGGTVQTTQTKTGAISSTEGTVTFGSSTDLWGLSLAPADVNGATFGCVAWVDSALADTYSIDDIYMRVYFAEPAATFLPRQSTMYVS